MQSCSIFAHVFCRNIQCDWVNSARIYSFPGKKVPSAGGTEGREDMVVRFSEILSRADDRRFVDQDVIALSPKREKSRKADMPVCGRFRAKKAPPREAAGSFARTGGFLLQGVPANGVIAAGPDAGDFLVIGYDFHLINRNS